MEVAGAKTMSAPPKYYHAGKIDAPWSGMISFSASPVVGTFSGINLRFEPMGSISIEETVCHACHIISNAS